MILIESPKTCFIEEMDENSFECAEKIYENLYHRRLTIGELDLLIAALCVENDYTLVTNNTKHFSAINELKIVDWTE